MGRGSLHGRIIGARRGSEFSFFFFFFVRSHSCAKSAHEWDTRAWEGWGGSGRMTAPTSSRPENIFQTRCVRLCSSWEEGRGGEGDACGRRKRGKRSRVGGGGGEGGGGGGLGEGGRGTPWRRLGEGAKEAAAGEKRWKTSPQGERGRGEGRRGGEKGREGGDDKVGLSRGGW